MELNFKHAGLSVSFECDDEDYYDHVDLLQKIGSLVEELSNHTGVSLVVLSEYADKSEETEEEED